MGWLREFLRRRGIIGLTHFHHPALGMFECDPGRPNLFPKSVAWEEGHEIVLILHGEEPKQQDLARAAEHFLAMREDAGLVRDVAADEAGLALFGKWLFEWYGDEEVSLAQWKRELRIAQIWVDGDGAVQVDFAFDHPFTGHHVTVSGTAPIGFETAYLSP